MTIWRAARYRAGDFRAPGRLWRDGTEPGRSRLEAILDEAGIEYYLPAEIEVRRSRRMRKLQSRRTALVAGYVFFPDPCDYAAVERLSCMGRFVRWGSELISIRQSEIDRLKAAEAAIAAEFADKVSEIAGKRLTRRDIADRFPVGSMAVIRNGYLAGHSVEVKAAKARKYIRAFIEALNVEVDVPVDALDAA